MKWMRKFASRDEYDDTLNSKLGDNRDTSQKNYAYHDKNDTLGSKS